MWRLIVSIPDLCPLSCFKVLYLSRRYTKEYLLCSSFADSLFVYNERDFMLSLSDKNSAEVIEAFNSTSRYLDDLLNVDLLFSIR